VAACVPGATRALSGDVLMSLAPFGEAALDHFMYIERPEGVDIADGAGFGHALHYRRIARPDMLAPSPQDYPSQGICITGSSRAWCD